MKKKKQIITNTIFGTMTMGRYINNKIIRKIYMYYKKQIYINLYNLVLFYEEPTK